MNKKRIASELIKIAKIINAGKINKGDMAEVDLSKAKKNMDKGQYGALEMYVKKYGNVVSVDFYNQREDKWIVSIEGARGSFDVPEEALSPTGKKDPKEFEKKLNQLVQILPTGAKFSNLNLSGKSLNLMIVNEFSAPPMTTKDVSVIENTMDQSSNRFEKFISGLIKNSKVKTNPYVHMIADGKKISFYKHLNVYINDENDFENLEKLADHIKSKLS